MPFSLNDDITDRILCLVPSFKDLHCMLLSSKRFHGIYQRRPQSILVSVARNEVGFGFSQAVRSVKFSLEKCWKTASTEDKHMVLLPMSGDALDPVQYPDNIEVSALSSRELQMVVAASRVARGLQDSYSQSYKDHRVHKKSRLTREESERFSRAVYRIMTFSEIFYPAYYAEFLTYGTESAQTWRERMNQRQKDFLQSYPSVELQEIKEVASFFVKLARRAWEFDRERASTRPAQWYARISLCCGPSLLYEAYTERSLYCYIDSDAAGGLFFFVDDRDLEAMRGYLTGPLDAILQERETGPPPNRHSAILDFAEPKHRCLKCFQVKDKLWEPSSYKYLDDEPSFDPENIVELLKGNLQSNKSVKELLDEKTSIIESSGSLYAPLIQQLKAYHTPMEDLPDGEVCGSCIRKHIREFLHFWLLPAWMDEMGHDFENCLHGYDCIQQRSWAHSEDYNHLCEPLSKDQPLHGSIWSSF